MLYGIWPVEMHFLAASLLKLSFGGAPTREILRGMANGPRVHAFGLGLRDVQLDRAI